MLQVHELCRELERWWGLPECNGGVLARGRRSLAISYSTVVRWKDHLGVGFLVHKRIAEAVLNWEPISSRHATIRIAATPRNLSVVQIHAPQTDLGDNEVELFYEQLEDAIWGIRAKTGSQSGG